jgi:hypothetical protein
MFRDAYRPRRCVVPVDDFFEWKAIKGKPKQPYAIAMRDGSPFGIGGLWENWKDPTSGELDSHSVRRTDGARPIAISCLGAFLDAGRSSAWLPLYSPASKNLHRNGHWGPNDRRGKVCWRGKRRKLSQPPSIKSEWMGRSRSGRYSNANMRFQSFFMLMTVQPSLSRCGCRRGISSVRLRPSALTTSKSARI